MENWEQKFNNVQTPDGSVNSHRQALRNNLKNVKPRSRARSSALIATLVLVLGLSGLTVANPEWVSNIVKIVKHEAYFTSEDGKQEYHVKTLEIEGPADSVAQHIARMKENGEVGDWTLDPADPSNSELLKSGAQKMVIVEAEVEDHGDGAPQEKQMIIESRDGGKTFTVNGETISAEAMAEIQAQHGIVKDVIDVDGGQFITTQSAEEIPATFELGQNYPNPFNPTTQIPFEIKEAGNVTLKVYDMTGREVKTLLDGYQSVGSHTVMFDGAGLASGTYLYKLYGNGFQFSRTMALVK
jgi:hypothetical protein